MYLNAVTKKLGYIIISSSLLMGFSLAQAKLINLVDEKRILFKKAETSLGLGRTTRLQQQLKALGDYPLVPYLEYEALKKRLHKANHQEVKAFLEKYRDFPFAYQLRGRWLDRLANSKDWDAFLQFYDKRSNTTLKCQSFEARIHSKKTKGLIKDIENVWMSGYSQPAECDPAFAYLLKNHTNTTSIIWKRIEKAFKARKTSLALYLAKKLNKPDQDKVWLWRKAHKNPEKMLKQLKKKPDTMLNRKIIIHALDRLARKNAIKADKSWSEIQKRFKFNQAQKDQIQKRIALSSAYQHLPEAKKWLEALPEKLKSDQTDLWLARINIREQDWAGLIATINHMPEELQNKNEWQYWLARSFEALGYTQRAHSQFNTLSKESSYYAFLAADKVKKPYQIESQKVVSTVNENKLLGENPHLLRARELFFVDRPVDARREWFKGIRKLSTKEIKEAAKLASNWNWHDSAIKTVAKTSHRKDYDLRFPMPYRDLVMQNAKSKKLDPAVVYGVMRRESLFDPLAGSRVGALGLMQLMPSTAKQVAKSLGMKRPKKAEILKVENNIRLGTQYFKKVLDKFDDNTTLAAAAYNAGPNKVKTWLPEQKSMDADLWVETIPYNETRKYVQAVLAYSTIFDKALGQDVAISSRMQDIKDSY